MKCQGAEGNVEALLRKLHILHGGAPVLHLRIRSLFPGHLKHFAGYVNPHSRSSSMLHRIDTVPAVSASQIQHPLSGKIGKQLF